MIASLERSMMKRLLMLLRLSLKKIIKSDC